MEAVVTAENDGDVECYVGLKVCEGPGTYRLVLTRPYHHAGRIVEIPSCRIASVDEVESTSLGEEPHIVERLRALG